MVVDTHIHLDDERYNEDLEDVLKRAKEGGVTKFIIPGADPDTLQKAVEISKKYEDVYFAVGVHPYDIDKYDEDFLKKYIEDEKCVAVGECGLDYFRLEGSQEEKLHVKERQKEVFVKQIELAKRYNKPLIVHIRDASRDAKEVLLQNSAKEVGGVLHCFNADEELLSLANEGFYFGIGGVVTFKNAKKLVNVLSKVPQEKLLIETDGPYLTPTPHRGSRNEPLYTKLVVEKVAELLGDSSEEIEDLTTTNAIKLFNIN